MGELKSFEIKFIKALRVKKNNNTSRETYFKNKELSIIRHKFYRKTCYYQMNFAMIKIGFGVFLDYLS